MAVAVRTAGVFPSGTSLGAFPVHSELRGTSATTVGTPVETQAAGEETTTFTTLTVGAPYIIQGLAAVPPRAQQLKRTFSGGSWDSNPAATDSDKRSIRITGA